MKELILKPIFYIPTEPKAHLTPLGTPCAVVNTWSKCDRFQTEVFYMLSPWTNHHIRKTTGAEAHLPSPHLYWSIQKKKKHKIGNYSNYSSADRLTVSVGNCLCCIWWCCTLRAVVGQLWLNAFRSCKGCRNLRRKSVQEEQRERRGGQISLAAHMQADPEGVTLTDFPLGPPCQIQWAQNQFCSHEQNK